MTSLSEQRAAVKFCFLLGKNAAETVEMLKTAYKDDAMGKTQVYEWFSRYINGDMSIQDKPRSGRPSTSRTDENLVKVKEFVLADRRQTIEQISEASGLSWSSIQRILTEDLNMKRVAAKFVPRALTDFQKERRIEACRDLKQQLEANPDLLSKIITGDKSWCYGYDPVPSSITFQN
ncbi:protein GVQW3-like [Macrosteles quadrilineatus]|uniref:protein GVQW3-like n=1 Tax=Macrosteles quadrilineatus TaxID=74068 RepID=UPI0023E1F5AB|nr:protein GVQW3-like [Macrosteles quadrilineatus]